MELSPYQGALIPIDAPEPRRIGFRPAAVLLGLCQWWTPQGRLFAIRRALALRDHGGQIGFPGGKAEDSDAGLVETALRETHEEIGLEPARVQVLGRLSGVPTPSGFWIVPFVGLLDTQSWIPRIDSGEVDELLYLSRVDLQNPKNYLQRGHFQRAGHRVPRHEYQVCEPALWGASAHMVHELLSRWSSIKNPSRGG